MLVRVVTHLASWLVGLVLLPGIHAAQDKVMADGSSSEADAAGGPRLLAGGNPQIAKGDGDAPVAAYIAAMPGWKHDIGSQLDALIEQVVPGVRRAVRWNSPFYGSNSEQGWFVGFHCFTKYIKVSFFFGTALDPMPPIESKDVNARYFHIFEGDDLGETQLADWITQASQIPGWTGFC